VRQLLTGPTVEPGLTAPEAHPDALVERADAMNLAALEGK
jgi:hypothetical protein